MFVLLWCCKALCVYLWFEMCSFQLWSMLQMGDVQQVYLPYENTDLKLFIPSIFCVWPVQQEWCATVSTSMNIIVFLHFFILVWKVWVSVCSTIRIRLTQTHRNSFKGICTVEWLSCWCLLLLFVLCYLILIKSNQTSLCVLGLWHYAAIISDCSVHFKCFSWS